MKTLYLSLCLAPVLLSPVYAVQPTLLKTFGSSFNSGYGVSVAATEKHLLVGENSDDTKAQDAGAVNVLDPKTGKRSRQLFASDASAGAYFGSSVAISGNIALVGADYESSLASSAGAAYLFDLNTGKQLFKLLAPDGAAGDVFGYSVAVDGNRALVGSTKQNNRGAAYVFDVSTGAFLLKITADDAVAEDQFAFSVALSGNLAVIGAPRVDQTATDAGAAYVYDIRTGTKLHKLTPSTTAAKAGVAVAIAGHRCLIGAPSKSTSQGVVYVYDMLTGTELMSLQPADIANSSEFGNALSVSGHLALIGCSLDDGSFTNEGSAYLFDMRTGEELGKYAAPDFGTQKRLGSAVAIAGTTLAMTATNDNQACYLFTNLSTPLPLDVLTKKSDFVPDVANATFSSFSAFQINADGDMLLQSKLSGVSSAVSNILGSTLSGSHDVVMQTGSGRIIDDGETVTSLIYPQLQHSGSAVFQVKLTGKMNGLPITSANDVLLFREDGATFTQLLREGQTLSTGGFTSALLKSLGVQAASTTNEQVAVQVSLSASSTEDSAIILHDASANTLIDSVREGAASPFATVNYGQVASRVGMTGSDAMVSVALTGSTTQNAAVVKLGVSGPDVAIARKGDVAPGTSGLFSAFIGEGSNTLNQPLIRASLSGVSTSANEGLWANRSAALALVAQEGSQVTGLDTGVLFSSFVRAWMLPTDLVLFLSTVKGKGVSSSNDQCLFLALPDGTLHLLLREGGYAPGCEGAKIGSISQVDVDVANATYAVIATLSGTSSASSLALFIGDADRSIAPGYDEFLRPRLLLRKGSYQGMFGTTSALSSMKLLLPTESTGIGGRGLGGTIAGNRVAVQLGFSNGSVLVGTLE
jgi:hypothetical protein